MNTRAQTVERIDIYDNDDNRLYYLTYDYDNGKNLVSRTFYDRTDYFLKRITVDAGGKRNFKDDHGDLYNSIKYTIEPSQVKYEVYDHFAKERWVFQGSYKKASAGNYNFYDNSSVQTHSMKYEYADTMITRINVYDKSSNLTHYVNVKYQGVGIRPGSDKNNGLASFNIFANQRNIRLSFSLKSKQKVKAEVFDVRGIKAGMLLHRFYAKGRHSVSLNTASHSFAKTSGIYILRVWFDNAGFHRKILIIN
jgi:hypothetical protein